MRRSWGVLAAFCFVCIGVLALLLVSGLWTTPTLEEVHYVEPTGAIHSRSGQTISNAGISLKLNGVSDAQDPLASYIWVNYSNFTPLHAFPLAPPQGDKYLVANVTFANLQNKSVPFRYSSFVLVGSDGNAYYANNAVCDQVCSANALSNRTLAPLESGDVYILFSVPASMDAAKISYQASSGAPVVISL